MTIKETKAYTDAADSLYHYLAFGSEALFTEVKQKCETYFEPVQPLPYGLKLVAKKHFPPQLRYDVFDLFVKYKDVYYTNGFKNSEEGKRVARYLLELCFKVKEEIQDASSPQARLSMTAQS